MSTSRLDRRLVAACATGWRAIWSRGDDPFRPILSAHARSRLCFSSCGSRAMLMLGRSGAICREVSSVRWRSLNTNALLQFGAALVGAQLRVSPSTFRSSPALTQTHHPAHTLPAPPKTQAKKKKDKKRKKKTKADGRPESPAAEESESDAPEAPTPEPAAKPAPAPKAAPAEVKPAVTPEPAAEVRVCVCFVHVVSWLCLLARGEAQRVATWLCRSGRIRSRTLPAFKHPSRCLLGLVPAYGRASR